MFSVFYHSSLSNTLHHFHTQLGMTPMTHGNPTAEPRRNFLLGLLLFVVTLALYWPATTHGFMLLDDGTYVSGNAHVINGFSFAALKWAFTSTYASNWHPLTWLSHMLDCSLFGLNPGGHHFTNILLHAANTLLLFLALERLTQSLWPSFWVAALFGWHPLHVESVAWLAERKDVLSTFFGLLALLSYAAYAQQSKIKNQKSKIYCGLALLFFALGLMSKPMLVTLPFVLLLLDYWPLRRISDPQAAKSSPGPHSELRTAPVRKDSAIEKLPFFALAFAACVATVVAQHGGGAIRTAGEVPFRLRILNALTAYASYAGKTIWPAHLSVYYLLPDKIPVAPAICAALAMIAVTLFAFRCRARWPWLLVGWLWFAGTLVPVIGLVQVGSQAMADRYMYVPAIGLFIAVVWSFEHALGKWRTGRIFACGLAAAASLACLALTTRQLSFWRDNVALFQHAVEATPGNYFAEYELGRALESANQRDAAIQHLDRSLQLNPLYEPAHYHIGIDLTAAGKVDEAAFHFTEALKRDPNSEELRNNLGVIFAQQNKLEAAVEQFEEAIRIAPEYPKPYLNCALALQRLGRNGPALAHFTKARELEPDSPSVMMRFASFLATCPDPQWRDPAAALKLAQTADNLTQHNSPTCLATLAVANAANSNYSNAVAISEQALAQARQQHEDDLVKKLEADLPAYRAGKMPR